MVEPLEIAARHLARAQMRRCRRRCAAPPRSRAGPAAGRHASRRCPRGIHLDVEPEPLGLGAERRLGERRAADIAEADEQDLHSHRTQALLPKRPALLAKSKQKHNRGDAMASARGGSRAGGAGQTAHRRLCLVRPVRPGAGLHHQFRRPADPLDPGRRHQARPRRRRTRRSASSTAPPSPSSTPCSASRSGGSPTAGIAAG